MAQITSGMIGSFPLTGGGNIIYQQLAGSAAEGIYKRFVTIYSRFTQPAQLLAIRDSQLCTTGLSARKLEYLWDLVTRGECQKVATNALPPVKPS